MALQLPTDARCAARSLAVGEPMAGSAPTALGWVALEQNGPWGAKAFTASHLDPDLGRQLETAATMAGVRPSLVRRPGHHADHHTSEAHRVLVAHSMPGRSWLLSGCVDDPAALLDLDWRAVADGDLEATRRSLPALAPAPVDEAHLLVCTNGTRDVCCAVTGRPVAAAAALRHPGRVWEATHTSGHRFAPTAALLPYGTLHGRLDGDSAAALLDAAARGETVLDGARGRSTWPAAGQVAEQAVREATGELSLDALLVARSHPDWVVRHQDGRSWRVVLREETTDVSRPESCGKPALEMCRQVVESVTAL